jgi:hypothetical protein
MIMIMLFGTTPSALTSTLTMRTMLLTIAFGFVVISFLGVDSATATNKVQQQQPEAYQQRMVDWLREHPNGYFNPSIQWKRLFPNGPYAMHAVTDILKGAELITVPREYMIDSTGDNANLCSVVHKLVEESYKVLGNGNDNDNDNESSFYEPYVSYLFDPKVGGTSRGLLPASWSMKGQQILNLILDIDIDIDISSSQEEVEGQARLEPTNFHLHGSVFDACRNHIFPTPPPSTSSTSTSTSISPEQQQQQQHKQHIEDAYLFYISRSWINAMIPVIDMVNHRNGHHKNVEMTNADDSLLEESASSSNNNTMIAYAFRDIKAGEQLVYTYSECLDDSCDFGGLKYAYTTQDIFRDYGFTELYPRRYVLGGGIKTSGNDNSGVYPFEDDEDDEDDDDEYNGDEDEVEDEDDAAKTKTKNEKKCSSDNVGGGDGHDDQYCSNNNNNDNQNQHQRLVAEIDILYDNDNNEINDSNNEQKKMKVFKWIFETPNNLTLQWIQEQLSRLQIIESKVHDGITTLRQQQQQQQQQELHHNIQHEIDSILEFYEGYIEVLALALEHKNDPIGVTEEQFQQELALLAM